MPDEIPVEQLSVTEYSQIRTALSDLINGYSGISAYFSVIKPYCEINNIADDKQGVGIFDLQGAKYVKKYIDGSFDAQYPFSVLIRKICATDKSTLDMATFFEGLGTYLETLKPLLNGNRKVINLTQTIAVFVNNRTEGNVVTMQANFLLKYRKEDE